KTPLAVIKACVETLLDGAAADPEPRGKFLQQVADQAERLHALILDLLSLARIESGTEAFEFAEVPLAPVVAACLDRHRARAEARAQTLEAVPPDGDASPPPPVTLSPCHLVTSSPPHPLTAWADEEVVGQILDNL